MEAMTSSVLIIDYPNPKNLSIGANFAKNLKEALTLCQSNAYAVISIPADTGDNECLTQLFSLIEKKSNHTQFVIIKRACTQLDLQEIINKCQVFRIIESYDIREFENIVKHALELNALFRQQGQLISLLNEQNENLTRMSQDLEHRVEKRQQNIKKAKQKLVMTNQKVKGLQKVLVAIHRANSIAEMERLVQESLQLSVPNDWTRIILKPKNLMNSHISDLSKTDSVFSAPLIHSVEHIGNIYFGRSKNKPFSKTEDTFLLEIADAISPAVVRLSKLDHSENLKHQWEATFDAITRPLSLIDCDYNIIRCNRSYASRAHSEPQDILNKKCYRVLFDLQKPCSSCKLGSKFRLPDQATINKEVSTFEVSSQSFKSPGVEFPLFINMYHDVSESVKLERQVLESTKLAELGLIGSSIAHELNNPLGGILNFLQLIKMDLQGQENYYEDIDEMEKAVRRCQEIIENLLGFTRKPARETNTELDLRTVLKEVYKIYELKTKSKGIEIKLTTPERPLTLKGQRSLLSQALGYLLKLSLDYIESTSLPQSSARRAVYIDLSSTDSNYVIYIKCDSAISSKNKELNNHVQGIEQITSALDNKNNDIGNQNEKTADLQIANKIISEHLGSLKLDITSVHFIASVKFPHAEPIPKSQEIDSQI